MRGRWWVLVPIVGFVFGTVKLSRGRDVCVVLLWWRWCSTAVDDVVCGVWHAALWQRLSHRCPSDLACTRLPRCHPLSGPLNAHVSKLEHNIKC